MDRVGGQHKSYETAGISRIMQTSANYDIVSVSIEHVSSLSLGKAGAPEEVFQLFWELGLELPGRVLGVMLRGFKQLLVACLSARSLTFASARRLPARFEKPKFCSVDFAAPGRRKHDFGEERAGGAGCAHNVLYCGGAGRRSPGSCVGRSCSVKWCPSPIQSRSFESKAALLLLPSNGSPPQSCASSALVLLLLLLQ